jgi:methylene-tetrahydromethanopterin dehydrogenase
VTKPARGGAAQEKPEETTMDKPRILHFLTPLANLSPFDVNMAVDAGFVVAGYTGIETRDIAGLTQDAMFSRAPQDAAKTVLFIGGRCSRPSRTRCSPTRRAPSRPPPRWSPWWRSILKSSAAG